MYLIFHYILSGKGCKWRVWLETCPWGCFSVSSQYGFIFSCCWHWCSAGHARSPCHHFGNYWDVVYRVRVEPTMIKLNLLIWSIWSLYWLLFLHAFLFVWTLMSMPNFDGPFLWCHFFFQNCSSFLLKIQNLNPCFIWVKHLLSPIFICWPLVLMLHLLVLWAFICIYFGVYNCLCCSPHFH